MSTPTTYTPTTYIQPSPNSFRKTEGNIPPIPSEEISQEREHSADGNQRLQLHARSTRSASTSEQAQDSNNADIFESTPQPPVLELSIEDKRRWNKQVLDAARELNLEKFLEASTALEKGGIDINRVRPENGMPLFYVLIDAIFSRPDSWNPGEDGGPSLAKKMLNAACKSRIDTGFVTKDITTALHVLYQRNPSGQGLPMDLIQYTISLIIQRTDRKEIGKILNVRDRNGMSAIDLAEQAGHHAAYTHLNIALDHSGERRLT